MSGEIGNGRVKRYDYIIVGGGSSACVVAARLVRDGKARVLLLERGARRASAIMHCPAGYMKFLAKDTYLAMHKTRDQPQLGGRSPIVPQAKVLGGGGTVNAMVYMRGQAADYDRWNASITAPGSEADGAWSYRDMLPYFKQQEDNDHLAGEYHGVGGPVKISNLGHTSSMSRAFVKTMQEMGIPYNPDFNGARQFGVGFMQHTIDWRTRRRCSPVDAFLAPLMDDPLLAIETEATATRIRMEGCRAAGIDYVKDGATISVEAGEIILAAGAFQTPKLMMLSGIGPEHELLSHGIGVRVALPGVGRNLQDHYECPVVATTRGAFGYYGQDRGWPMIKAGIEYLLFKSGPVTTTGVETCAFLDPAGAHNDEPTIQMFCVPTIYLDRDVTGANPGHGVTINSLLLRPKGRGSVTLACADPFADPVIDTQIFAHPDDLATTVAGLRFARRVLSQSPMRDLVDREIFPGRDIDSDEALAEHCRRTVKTGYHPVGTCRMGHDDDPNSVLTPDLRVRGVERLRVTDASIMPTIVSGNTNAAVLAAAGKAADLILS